MSGYCGHGWLYHLDGPSGPCYKCVMEDNKRLRDEIATRFGELSYVIQQARMEHDGDLETRDKLENLRDWATNRRDNADVVAEHVALKEMP